MTRISLFELNEYVRQVIALNFTEPLWIRAEINQVSFSRGHCYLDLIEKKEDTDEIIAQASAAIWYRNLRFIEQKTGPHLNQLLQKGIQALLKVRVEFNERYGLKLSIEDIDTTYTLGQLELKRREILQQLGAMGLMDKNKGHAFPPVLQRLAVISSEKAAGFQDFIQHLQSNDYGFAFECELYSAAMQGRNVEKEILQAFQEIRQVQRPYDAVIIIRGGGSRLDLAAFDSLQLCVAIANLEYPVITGIGHEIDQAVADLVAHTSLKTPTAVAHFILDHNFKFETQLYAGYRILQKAALEIIESFQSRLRRQGQFIKDSSLHRLGNENYFIAGARKDLQMHTLRLIRENQIELHNLNQRIDLLDPALLLKRGYSMTFKDGILIKSSQQTESGDLIETRLASGSIRSTVK